MYNEGGLSCITGGGLISTSLNLCRHRPGVNSVESSVASLCHYCYLEYNLVELRVTIPEHSDVNHKPRKHTS